MTEQPIPSRVQAPVVWSPEDVDRVPVLAANQFVVQSFGDPDSGSSDVLLTVGYVAPPLIMGSPEDQQRALAALDHVTARPLARFLVPTGKAADLARVIQDVLRRLETDGQGL